MASSIYGWSGKLPLSRPLHLHQLRLPRQGRLARATWLMRNRSEAREVPHLLVAPKAINTKADPVQRKADEGREEVFAGFYDEDEAYVAVPMVRASREDGHVPPQTAQQAYYDSLLARFRVLRATLRCTPPASTVQALASSQLVYLPADSKKAKAQWRLHLQEADPQMVQVACIDAESVLEIVKLFAGILRQGAQSWTLQQVGRLGTWAWAVLGRCPDRTELGSEEIAEVRALGKRACEAIAKMERKASAEPKPLCEDSTGVEDETKTGNHNLEEQVERDVPSMDGTESMEELEAARFRLQSRLEAAELPESEGDGALGDGQVRVNPSEEKDVQLRIILEMIIMVVGEVYGQRDLLECLDVWDS